MSAAHLQIQFHGENPQALPSKEKAKVADFYAAHDRTTPPLPWPSIAPPFSASSIGANRRLFVNINPALDQAASFASAIFALIMS